jgi:hypothetical protein
MKYLEELEQKVLRLIQKHQELQVRFDEVAKENELLRQQVTQFETTLLKESTTTQTLAQEKAAIVQSIEALLSSINALEQTH